MKIDSKLEDKYTTLDDIDDIRKNVGFHFTPIQNLESILENGLDPRIGANASGTLGQSAIPKTYISYGLEGVMQLYNRILNLSLEGKIIDFQDPSHKTFLPNTAQTRNIDSRLSILEGFEFVRQYMENNIYLVFGVTMSQYEHTLEDNELDEINDKIHTFTDENGENICDKIDFLNDQIEILINDINTNHSEEIDRYRTQRDRLAIEVWRKSSYLVSEKQGRLLNEDEEIIIDKIDYNDERLRWVNFEKNPHNTHTRIIEEQDGKISGIPILPQNIYQFSSDGESRGNGVQFFEKMYSFIKQSDRVSLQAINCVDVNLFNLFHEYVNLIEQYKIQNPKLLTVRPSQVVELDNGQTITYPEGITLDLDNISSYPGLEDFAQKASQYYQVERKKCSQIRKQLKERKEIGPDKPIINMETFVAKAIRDGVTSEDVIEAEKNEEKTTDKDIGEVLKND